MLKPIMCALLLLSLSACGSEPEPDGPEAATGKPPALELWSVTEGIDTPESAYVDPESGEIFVSIIGGMPAEKDGNGRIAQISPDGRAVDAMWVTGLNAPKGIRSYQGTLWTADIDEIVGIDMMTGKTMSKVKVNGAQFLNDVAVGEDGTVYVTDFFGNKIYSLKGGKVSVFAEGEDLEYPNGILVEANSLVVGGWGKPNSETDFSTAVPGRLYKLDLETKAKTLITPEPTANFDGLESDGRGGYIATDYIAGKLLRVSADGTVSTLTTFMPGTADIGFAPAENRLLIPHMNENRIAAYDISGGLQ